MIELKEAKFEISQKVKLMHSLAQDGLIQFSLIDEILEMANKISIHEPEYARLYNKVLEIKVGLVKRGYK